MRHEPLNCLVSDNSIKVADKHLKRTHTCTDIDRQTDRQTAVAQTLQCASQQFCAIALSMPRLSTDRRAFIVIKEVAVRWKFKMFDYYCFKARENHKSCLYNPDICRSK